MFTAICKPLNSSKLFAPVFLSLIFRLAVCLAIAGVFCAIVWLLSLCGLCEMPTWQMFVAVAVLVYVFIVIRDTYLYIKNP